jgi:putative transcriptional regulator
MSDGERLAIVTWIAANPQAGDVIEGTGGARKVRFAGKGKGKSGGYRVIVLFRDGHSGILAQYFRQERKGRFGANRTASFEIRPGGCSPDLRVQRGVAMKKTKPTAGERMIASAKEALAFAKGRQNHGCEVHVPNEIDVKAIREKISLSQGEFAKLFGLSKRTLEHWEHGRRAPSGPARAFLTVIAREPDAVRRALLA